MFLLLSTALALPLCAPEDTACTHADTAADLINAQSPDLVTEAAARARFRTASIANRIRRVERELEEGCVVEGVFAGVYGAGWTGGWQGELESGTASGTIDRGLRTLTGTLFDTPDRALAATFGSQRFDGTLDADPDTFVRGNLLRDVGGTGAFFALYGSCSDIAEPRSCVVEAWSDWGSCDCATDLESRSRAVTLPPEPGAEDCIVGEARDCDVPCTCADVTDPGVCTDLPGCQFSDGACVDLPPPTRRCSVHTNEVACGYSSTCIWFDFLGECISTGTCTDHTTQENCETFGCAWDGLTCSDRMPTTCTEALYEEECDTFEGATCDWTPTTPPLGTCALAPDEDCAVGGWSDWDACSEVCDGTQSRSRSIVSEAVNGGAACPTLVETRTCNTGCP